MPIETGNTSQEIKKTPGVDIVDDSSLCLRTSFLGDLPQSTIDYINKSEFREKLLLWTQRYKLGYDEIYKEYTIDLSGSSQTFGKSSITDGFWSKENSDKTIRGIYLTEEKQIAVWKEDGMRRLMPGADRSFFQDIGGNYDSNKEKLYVSMSSLQPDEDMYDACYVSLMKSCNIDDPKIAQIIFRDLTNHKHGLYLTGGMFEPHDSVGAHIYVCHDFSDTGPIHYAPGPSDAIYSRGYRSHNEITTHPIQNSTS